MARKKPSFFDRLTGTVPLDEEEQFYDDDFDSYEEDDVETTSSFEIERNSYSEEEQEGSVGVEMYQTGDDIILKAMVAGVHPDDLDISITRETVVIKGRREGAQHVEHEDYFLRELEWGPFSRTIALPAEIEVEEAEAVEKHGLLIIKLPKINKERQTKLKVKSQ